MKPELHTFRQSTLRIALISDTHGYIDDNIVALIRECDIAIHAGDVMDECVLEAIQPRLKSIAVAGNNDRRGLWSSKHKRYTCQLPECALLVLPGGTIAVEHGHRFGFAQPCHDALRAEYGDARLIIYGHTHKQIIDKKQIPWICNPGAAGLVRNQGGPRCLLLDVEGDDWQVHSRRFG